VLIFTTQCYAERSIAMAHLPSVCLSGGHIVWFSSKMITHVVRLGSS